MVPLEAAVIFDANGTLTSGIVHVAGGSGITLLGGPARTRSPSRLGTEPNQMALFVNGVPVSGTTYGSGAGTQQNSGQAIIVVGAGDVVSLRNHSSAAAVGLATPIGGTQLTVNASMIVEKFA